jgi:nicotinamide-nucleotide amidase
MTDLSELAERVGAGLKQRRETVAVAESSSGGLVAAALLAVPGASAYFMGGVVIYTRDAKIRFLGIPEKTLDEVRSSSEPHAMILARTIREKMGTDWGIAETGAAGPTGNRYGDAAGHVCVAVSGPVDIVTTIETGKADRASNMQAFAAAALSLAEKTMNKA